MFLWILAIMIFASGLATLCRGLWIAKTWNRKTARIVRYSESVADEGGVMYHPIFVLRDSPSDEEYESPWGSWRQPFPIGSSIEVFVNPADERQIEIDCFSNMYGISATLFGLFGICLLFTYLARLFDNNFT